MVIFIYNRRLYKHKVECDLVCPEFDPTEKKCKVTGLIFREGMEGPCEYVVDPSKCRLNM